MLSASRSKVFHFIINLVATVGSHQQLINRLSWNNYNPKLIASCSQDCFIKIWDTTDAFSSKDFKEFKSIEQKEKIRDIQFSPFSEYYFLASYGSGLIRQWDTRKETSCVTEYSLHSVYCVNIREMF